MALSTPQRQITGDLAQPYPSGQELAKVTDLAKPTDISRVYANGHELAVHHD